MPAHELGEEEGGDLGVRIVDTLNDDGERLRAFATYHGLALVNTFFSTPKNRVSHTFNGRGRKRIDYILTRPRDRNLVRDVVV